MWKRFNYMEEANAGDQGGAGGAGGGQAADQAATSIISKGEDPVQMAAQKDAEAKANAELGYIPEKYRVKKEDGTFDLESSAKKQSEAFASLEKRLGVGEVRPNSEADYTFTVPDALKDHFKPEDDPAYMDFRKEAHTLGLTQKQFEAVVGRHLEAVSQIGGSAANDPAETEGKLRTLWPTEQGYQKNINAGYRAMAAYANEGGEDKVGSFINLDRKFGDDPDFIAFMANIGREIREDIPPIGALMSNEAVDALMKDPAYMDPNNPKHNEVKAKVKAHFDRQSAKAT